MNDNAKKWVAALKSGTYEQALSVLHVVDDGYCCLGVACDISGLGRWFVNVVDDDPDSEGSEPEPIPNLLYVEHGYDTDDIYHCSESVLPEGVQEWLGLATNGGDFALTDAQYKALSEKASKYGVDIAGARSLSLAGTMPPIFRTGEGGWKGSLTALNDAGLPFELIAYVVEMEPEGLFA